MIKALSGTLSQLQGVQYAMGTWLPIESAPKDMTRIYAAGYHRRADPGDKRVVDIIFWSWTWRWREVSLGENTYRKEQYRENEGWRRFGDYGERAIDFEPDFWMPLPEPPHA